MMQENNLKLITPLNPNAITINETQRRNPIVQSIRNVPYEFKSNIVPDYAIGTSTCVLFLSLKYHLLHPTYLFRRIKEVGRDYRLRVVLCLVDVDDNIPSLLEINKICFSNKFVLILSWSSLEAGRYIETLKAYEQKPPTSIQEKVDTEFLPKMCSILKCVRSINRSDTATLLEAFGHLRGICNAEEHELVLCPGLGEKKVKRLYEALHTPFKRLKGDSAIASSDTSMIPVDMNIEEDINDMK
jgi:DNA excision repair protein ERCC-1